MDTKKKNKLLQVRMSEAEIEELKKTAEFWGMDNVSDVIRHSINLFINATKKQPHSSDYVKTCDASSMLWVSKMLCNSFDIQEYFSEEGEKEDLNTILLDLYNNGEFNSLKKCVLDSITHDLNFNNELDPTVKEALNNLLNNK